MLAASAALALLALLGVSRGIARTGAAYPEASPRSTASYATLAKSFDAVLTAPPGSTGVVSATGPELAAYLSNYVLPVAGLPGYLCDVVLSPDAATLVLRDSAARPMALASLRAEGLPETLRLTQVWLGPVRLPTFCTDAISDVLSATVRSGELGLVLREARTTGERAYLTLTRH